MTWKGEQYYVQQSSNNINLKPLFCKIHVWLEMTTLLNQAVKCFVDKVIRTVDRIFKNKTATKATKICGLKHILTEVRRNVWMFHSMKTRRMGKTTWDETV